MTTGKVYRLVGFNCRYTHSCLALFYLRQALERYQPKASVELLQLTINDPYYKSLLRILEGEPEVLFFSAYIWNSDLLHRLLTDLARIRPGQSMVIGGPQAPFLGPLPSECTLVKGAIEDVDSCFYRDLGDNTLQSQYTGMLGETFPFPYQKDDFTGPLRNRQILYESSRGCPFSCSYCLSASSARVVHKDMATVEKELQQLLAARPPLVKFVDRTFNDNPDRALAIWRFLAQKEVATRFHFEVAPDRFNGTMLDFLATVPVGRFQFEIGIQSTAPETLAAVHRRMDVARALENIHRLSEPGNIHLHVDLILGLPGETMQSFAQSFRHVFACRPDYIQMGLLKILPGTPVVDDVDNYALLHAVHPPFEIFSTSTMNHRQIGELYLFGECVERFYNNRYFPSLFDYLRTEAEDPFAFFMDLLTLCRKRDFFHRSATQESMIELLLEATADREDAILLKELLSYDWLRCGHRFLPQGLLAESIAGLRSRLRRIMPQSLEPVYTAQERNRFFKQGIFCSFSADALNLVGVPVVGSSAIVCFLPMSASGLHGWNKIQLLPIDGEECS